MPRRLLQLGILWLLVGLSGSLAVSAQERNYTIQVASFPTAEEARELVDRLKAVGIEAYVVKASLPGIGIRHRVRYGRFKNAEEARVTAERGVKRGLLTSYIVTREEPPVQSKADDRQDEAVRPRSTPLPPGPLAVTRNTPDTPTPPPLTRPRVPLPLITIINASWELEPATSLPDHNWQALQFVDQLTGWIAGESGAIYRTTDGGRTWKPLSIDTDASLFSLCFIDWNRGWVLGKKEHLSSTLLFSTHNGGRTWEQSVAPELRKITFIDASAGWAIGSHQALLKTVDGGRTWIPIENTPFIPPPTGASTNNSWMLDDLYFMDSERGWLAASLGSPDQSRIGGLWQTSDAGTSWIPVSLPKELQDQDGTGKPGRWRAVRFFSPREGILAGELQEAGHTHSFALVTVDGGQSWRINRLSGNGSSQPHFASPARGWIIVDEKNGDESQVLSTQNGASTWTKDISIKGDRRLLLYFLSPTWGWLVGDGGILLTYREAVRLSKRP